MQKRHHEGPFSFPRNLLFQIAKSSLDSFSRFAFLTPVLVLHNITVTSLVFFSFYAR
jgi:hypothetical protein